MLKLTAFPADNRQVGLLRCPSEDVLGLPELLELHGQLALLDLIVGEDLQVCRKTEERSNSDEPLSRVILIPPDRVTVVHGELMVEVVVTFANGGQSGDEVVTGRVLVVEGGVTEPVRERVHAEGRLSSQNALIRRK